MTALQNTVSPESIGPQLPDWLPVYRLADSPPIAAILAAMDLDGASHDQTNRFFFAPPERLADTLTGPSDIEGAANFIDKVLVPGDATSIVAGQPLRLHRQRFTPAQGLGPIETRSTIVPITRQLNGFPVIGRSSMAALEFRNGRLEGLRLSWRRAIVSRECQTVPLTCDTVSDVIERFSRSLRTDDGGDVRVTLKGQPSCVYEDAGFNELIPKFRFLLSATDPLTSIAHEYEVTRAAIRTEQDSPDWQPTCIHSDLKSNLSVRTFALGGEKWTDNANLFAATFAAAPGKLKKALISEAALSTKKNQEIDSAQVALVESHGQPFEVQVGRRTLHGDFFDLVKSGGYGTGQGGQLQLLILHSCSVVRTPPVETGWPAWWPVFAGLSSILGYREDVTAVDGISASFACALGPSDPLVNAWLLEGAAKYGQGAGSVSRLSALSALGHESDSLSDLTSVPNPQGLVLSWLA